MRHRITDRGPVPEGARRQLQVVLAHPLVEFGTLPLAVPATWPGKDLGPGEPALLHQPGGRGPQHQGLEKAAGLNAQPFAVEAFGRGGLADQMRLWPGVDDPAPDVAGHQVMGLVLNDQIRS